MRRNILYTLAVVLTPTAAQPQFGYVPGNDFGVPQNASYDYVIIGGG